MIGKWYGIIIPRIIAALLQNYFINNFTYQISISIFAPIRQLRDCKMIGGPGACPRIWGGKGGTIVPPIR